MARISELHFSNDLVHPAGVEDFIEVVLDHTENAAGFIVSCYQTDGTTRTEIALTESGVLSSTLPNSNKQCYVISASRFPVLFAPDDRSRRVSAVALTDLISGRVVCFVDTRSNSIPIEAVDGAAAGAISSRAAARTAWAAPALEIPDQPDLPTPPIAKIRTTGGLACFGAGTRIRTAVGFQLIETLKEGDQIWTRDNALQPLQWIGKRTLPARGQFAPVQIAHDTFGAFRPHLVAPDHLVLLTGWRAELIYGETEILVPAKALVDNCDVRIGPSDQITYYHLAFDAPQIVSGDGVLSQCFHPDAEPEAYCAQAGRAEMFAHFPELATEVHVYGRNSHPTSKASLGPLLVRSG
ncbi:Hint domain-containing protein [Shimia sp. MMG029]|uniref:Hint domain-containing protein n=1 Tax=Shimia sp. MMG029 TaxID=3021978 RepID=UPI0022FE8E9B|nr:Hint domain-containing protein [Shimia sp. MMG029]MDA5556703.1 Hint domain-containing protein [Shimia sp. MMG029]